MIMMIIMLLLFGFSGVYYCDHGHKLKGYTLLLCNLLTFYVIITM